MTSMSERITSVRYISNPKQKKVDILIFFKDEVNNVFDTNIFRQVKTGNFINKAHVYLNS
jgi:hypothetical protein